MTNFIGFMAAFLTTISFLPQAIKVIRTRKTEGISLPMYALFTTGVLCWLLYGIMAKQMPIIMANTVTLVFAVIILYYTWRGNRK